MSRRAKGKRDIGFAKTRYCGIAKNLNHLRPLDDPPWTGPEFVTRGMAP